MDTNHFIMKRMFAIISAFCLGLFVSVAVIACADGTNDAPPHTTIIDCNCIPTIVSYDHAWLSGDGSILLDRHFDFTYDENGRIVRVTDVYVTFNVEYTKNSVIVVSEDMDSGGKQTTTVELKEEDMANPKATNAVIYMLFIYNYF